MLRLQFEKNNMNFTKHSNQKPSFPLHCGITELNEATCGSLCQHPSCWTSQRRQDKALPWTIPTKNSAWSSDSKNDLPMQSICNLLSCYGDSHCHCCRKSAGDHLPCNCPSAFSRSTRYKLRSPISKKANVISKPSCGIVINSRRHLVEAEKVFDRKNFTRGLNDVLCMPKQSYIWIPSPKKMKDTLQSHRNSLKGVNPNSSFIKNLTDCMMPEEIIERRQKTFLFADWPTMKKKHAQSRPHTEKLSANKRVVQGSNTVLLRDTIHSEGYLKSRAKLHSLVLGCIQDDTRDTLKKRQVLVTKRQVLDSSIPSNVLAQQKDAKYVSDDCKGRECSCSRQQSDHHCKITSVSLGLPELPTGIQTTRPFSYRKKDLDFSLGPVMSTMSSYPSFFHEDYSHVDTTVKSGAPSSLLIHSDSNKFEAEETTMSSGLATIAADPNTASVLLESDPAPGHRPMPSELADDCKNPSSVSDPALIARRQSVTRTKDDKILNETLRTYSPAPPPPSPEPRS